MFQQLGVAKLGEQSVLLPLFFEIFFSLISNIDGPRPGDSLARADPSLRGVITFAPPAAELNRHRRLESRIHRLRSVPCDYALFV